MLGFWLAPRYKHTPSNVELVPLLNAAFTPLDDDQEQTTGAFRQSLSALLQLQRLLLPSVTGHTHRFPPPHDSAWIETSLVGVTVQPGAAVGLAGAAASAVATPRNDSMAVATTNIRVSVLLMFPPKGNDEQEAREYAKTAIRWKRPSNVVETTRGGTTPGVRPSKLA